MAKPLLHAFCGNRVLASKAWGVEVDHCVKAIGSLARLGSHFSEQDKPSYLANAHEAFGETTENFDVIEDSLRA